MRNFHDMRSNLQKSSKTFLSGNYTNFFQYLYYFSILFDVFGDVLIIFILLCFLDMMVDLIWRVDEGAATELQNLIDEDDGHREDHNPYPIVLSKGDHSEDLISQWDVEDEEMSSDWQ